MSFTARWGLLTADALRLHVAPALVELLAAARALTGPKLVPHAHRSTDHEAVLETSDQTLMLMGNDSASHL